MPFALNRTVVIAAAVTVAAIAIGSVIYFTRGKSGPDPHSSNPNQKIVGAWVMEDSPSPLGAMAFGEDGGVTNPFVDDDSVPRGHFKISGDDLTITMDSVDNMGATVDFKFVFDGDNHLDLKMAKQKQTLHMRRIRPEEMAAIKEQMKGLSKPDAGFMKSTLSEPQSESAKATTCLSNVKQQAMGMAMYSTDYDQAMPGDQWSQSLLPYIKYDGVFTCPALKSAGQTGGYALKSSLKAARIGQIPSPATEVMVFEVAALGLNYSADISEMLQASRHDGKRSVGYVDGHAKSIKDGDLP